MGRKNNFFSNFRNNALLHIFVVNLRYLIGLGFIPSGMIKVMDKPFTRVENTGVFFDFLDALYATGFYYNMIGVVQVVAGILLITQRYATLGAAIFLPVIFNIAILTLSTIGSLTPVIATSMLFGIIFLLMWDYYKWIDILRPDHLIKMRNPAQNFLTANKIQIYTGVCIIILPIPFFLMELPKTGILALSLILVAGNLFSEWKHPVLIPIFKKSF